MSIISANQIKSISGTARNVDSLQDSTQVNAIADSKISTLTNQIGADTGASLVGFKANGTGAVASTVQDKLRESVSVKDFGAVGDGVTDDTAAVQAALTYLSTKATGGELTLSGRIKITSAVSQLFTTSDNVKISGNGAVIDATSITSGSAISLGGQRLTSTNLTTNAIKSADSFTVTSSAGITKGTYLLITSTDLWNTSRAYYYRGEIVLVDQVIGNAVTGVNPLWDSYSSATTTVHILDMPQITFDGVSIECNADITALQILYARNPMVCDCTVSGSRYAGIYIGYILGGCAQNNFISDVWNGIVTGTSYGISVGSGQGFKVLNNTIYGARHSVAGGGFEPTRQLIIANNTAHNSLSENVIGSIDLHGNTEFCTITGNTASSIIVGGRNTAINANTITSSEADVPSIRIAQTMSSDYYNVMGNTVNNSGASSIGFWLSPTLSGLSVESFSFADNYFNCAFTPVLIQPTYTTATGYSIKYISLSNNLIKSLTSIPLTVNLNGAATVTCEELKSIGNVYDGVSNDGFLWVSGNPLNFTCSIGDTFKANKLNGNVASFAGIDVSLIAPKMYGNTGGAGVSRAVRYNNTGRISVVNPVFSNLTFKSEISAATEYFEQGWYSATPTINNASNARLVSAYGVLGRVTSYGVAAPTINTWAVGDRVFNQSPVVGQPKSWVCTVAGTPGTWVSEGNL